MRGDDDAQEETKEEDNPTRPPPRSHGIIVEGGVKKIENARIPFAWVSEVHEHSPAADAGLLVGDAIVQFGWADSSSHDNLQALAKIVGASIGQPIKIAVLRKTEATTIDLVLTPNKWEGKGVLG